MLFFGSRAGRRDHRAARAAADSALGLAGIVRRLRADRRHLGVRLVSHVPRPAVRPSRRGRRRARLDRAGRHRGRHGGGRRVTPVRPKRRHPRRRGHESSPARICTRSARCTSRSATGSTSTSPGSPRISFASSASRSSPVALSPPCRFCSRAPRTSPAGGAPTGSPALWDSATPAARSASPPFPSARR